MSVCIWEKFELYCTLKFKECSTFVFCLKSLVFVNWTFSRKVVKSTCKYIFTVASGGAWPCFQQKYKLVLYLRFFSQLIVTTGSQNTGPDIIIYYRFWARVPTKMALIIFSEVTQTSPISHLKAMTICYQNFWTKKYN